MDRYSPLAPALVRVLILPVGQIERSRFLGLVDRLKKDASIIPLSDVAPHVGDEQILLSSTAFPQGSLLYNYTTSVPSEHHHQLSPYELFREPLLVLGVVDGLGRDAASGLEELGEAFRYLREKHQRVVSRQVLLIEQEGNGSAPAKEDVVRITEAGLTHDVQLQNTLHKVSARFLDELSTYTRALQASPSIQTPGQTARSLQRSASTREQTREAPSGRSTPTQASDAGSPVDGAGVRTPPYSRSSPATSFDQIATNAHNALSRSESRASNRARHGGRAASQDRVSVQGFGSISQDKLKNRGKARVGIVTGLLYTMAGQWGEAMKTLVDNTHKARTLSDFLWHAKGMESIVICLLLHAWAGIEFQIPTICYPLSDRMASGHSQRFSINMPSDFRTAEAAQKAALHRLSNYLPDLIKQILSLYDSGEASLELPFLVISEATVRCCKLLVTLQRSGELGHDALDQLLRNPGLSINSGSQLTGATSGAQSISNTTIANTLADAQPMPEDHVPLPDQVAILAGMASLYTALRMKRKRAAAMREMVVKLTHALTQARKRGAAEMGIHPAATLSAENGAESILATMELSDGLHQMLEGVAASYGVSLLDASAGAVGAALADSVGNDALKQAVLTELSAFCEASPDLQGLLRVNTALMRSVRPSGAVGTDVANVECLSREEQLRLTSTISRSIGVSKHLGLSKLEATYWDPYLVREVRFTLPAQSRAILSRGALNVGSSLPTPQTAANPLLYDPNASRPGTAADARQSPARLVQGETGECIVTLQNPYESPIEIESISFLTEGADLSVSHQVITIHALRLQEIPLAVSANTPGDCKVTGCRIKIVACVAQDFAIFRKPWAASTSLLVKDSGQEAGVLPIDRPAPPASDTILATVLESQPLLVVENTSVIDAGLMLLDGESQELYVVLKNESTVAASIADCAVSKNTLMLEEDAGGAIIIPGESKTFKLKLRGKAGVSRVQATFSYGCQQEDTGQHQYVRVLSVPIELTVNASLQVQNLDLVPLSERHMSGDAFMVSFDVGNAWPKSLDYECMIAHWSKDAATPAEAQVEGTLAPGQIQRIFLSLPQMSLPCDAMAETIRTALLDKLSGHWAGDGRRGSIDFSKLHPSAETLEMLRGTAVDLRLELTEFQISGDQARRTVKAGAFTSVRVRILNRAVAGLPLVVNLHPRAPEAADAAAAEEDDRRFAVAGAQHRILPPLPIGQETCVDFIICPLLAGALEIDARVRPAQMMRAPTTASWCVQRTLSLEVR